MLSIGAGVAVVFVQYHLPSAAQRLHQMNIQ